MSELAEDLSPEEDEDTLEVVNPDVDKAMKNGWRPKENWEGDDDDWVSAKKFNERGEMIGSIRELKSRLDKRDKEFESRLDNVNKLHGTQQKALLDDLETKRKAAIELADVDQANKIQGTIDDLKTAPVAVEKTVDTDSSLDDWNAANPWIYDTSPKAAYAQARFNAHSKTMTASQAIKSMESEVTQAFPDVNTRRDNASSVEGGKSRPGQRQVKKLAWSDLTSNEVKYFNAMPGAWKKDEYLQAVSDSRKA